MTKDKLIAEYEEKVAKSEEVIEAYTQKIREARHGGELTDEYYEQTESLRKDRQRELDKQMLFTQFIKDLQDLLPINR